MHTTTNRWLPHMLEIVTMRNDRAHCAPPCYILLCMGAPTGSRGILHHGHEVANHAHVHLARWEKSHRIAELRPCRRPPSRGRAPSVGHRDYLSRTCGKHGLRCTKYRLRVSLRRWRLTRSNGRVRSNWRQRSWQLRGKTRSRRLGKERRRRRTTSRRIAVSRQVPATAALQAFVGIVPAHESACILKAVGAWIYSQ